MENRREFIIRVSVASGAALAASSTFAAVAMVDEKDAQAQSLGYKADASKVDKKKYPQYVSGNSCASCGLYQGKAGDPSGPCGIFAGKAVSAKGWCISYNKKT